MSKARDLARVSPNGSGQLPLASAVSGTLPDANAPSGSVIQVVSVVYGAGGANTSTTSSTRSDTGITATITPSNTNNKIHVTVHVGGCSKSGGTGSGPYLAFFLMRASTDLIKFEGEGGYNASTNSVSYGACSTTYLDSPSTTSATVYKVQFANSANAGSVSFNNSATQSTSTLMEIAA